MLLQARTLTDTDVNLPRRSLAGTDYNGSACKAISKVSWVCTSNPEETALIISGGTFMDGAAQGVTVLDFGVTPAVAVTSYQAMGKHYANPRRQRVFPTPGHAAVVDFIPLPRDNPFYCGGFNPTAVIFRLASGELATLSYPMVCQLLLVLLFLLHFHGLSLSLQYLLPHRFLTINGSVCLLLPQRWRLSLLEVRRLVDI